MSGPTRKAEIETPRKSPKAEMIRAISRMSVGAIPTLGPLLSELSDRTLPNLEKEEQDRWQIEITSTVNSLQRRVEPAGSDGSTTIELTGLTASVAIHMIENCASGFGSDLFCVNDMISSLNLDDRDELQDILSELESFNLIETQLPSDYYTITEYGYLALDPPIKGWNPCEDARMLVSYIVGLNGHFATHELEQAVGWPRRRLNPALSIISRMIACKGNEAQPNYKYSEYYATRTEMAQLKRFAKSSS